MSDLKQLERAKRLKEIGRDMVYHKALSFGENLMPYNVVDIIEKVCPTLDDFDKRDLLEDVYTSCGFVLPANTEDREIV